jgi:membrane protein
VSLAQGWGLIQRAFAEWSDDYAPSMGAALSYYTLFSVAPLLLIVISVAGLVFGPEAARGEIFGQLRGLMGADGAEAIEALLQHANKPEEGVIATVIGVCVLLLGASTVFGELQNDLDRIWRAPAAKQSSGLWKLLHSRLLSFGMILGIAFLLMVSLVVSAALSALGKFWGPAFKGWEIFGHLLDVVVSFGLMTLIFAMIYKIMPRVRIAWRDVWVGAAVTAILFVVGKFLIGLYLGKASVGSAFGAAGSLVVAMVWVYYSAQIFLLGAEFTKVYAHAHGSRSGQPIPAAPAIPHASRPAPAPHRRLPRRLQDGLAARPVVAVAGALVVGLAAGIVAAFRRR